LPKYSKTGIGEEIGAICRRLDGRPHGWHHVTDGRPLGETDVTCACQLRSNRDRGTHEPILVQKAQVPSPQEPETMTIPTPIPKKHTTQSHKNPKSPKTQSSCHQIKKKKITHTHVVTLADQLSNEGKSKSALVWSRKLKFSKIKRS
jgi:hypothetical protein